MKIRTIISALIFLSLCTAKLLLPQKVDEIRNYIVPAISREPDYREDIIALGRMLSGDANDVYAWERKKHEENEQTKPEAIPMSSPKAMTIEGFVLSEMIKQNLYEFEAYFSNTAEVTDALTSTGNQNKGTSLNQSVDATTAEATSDTASAISIAPEPTPIEAVSAATLQSEKVDEFLRVQSAFADYAVPANVSYETLSLPFDSSMPAEGSISSCFGYRVHPIYGDVRFHYGTDFDVVDGDAISAFADGTVISTQVFDGYGLTVMLDHGNGYTTLYAHCSQILVKLGDSVKCGDMIALVGHSGLVTGPHLHFELVHDGKYLNSEFYLL